MVSLRFFIRISAKLPPGPIRSGPRQVFEGWASFPSSSEEGPEVQASGGTVGSEHVHVAEACVEAGRGDGLHVLVSDDGKARGAERVKTDHLRSREAAAEDVDGGPAREGPGGDVHGRDLAAAERLHDRPPEEGSDHDCAEHGGVGPVQVDLCVRRHLQLRVGGRIAQDVLALRGGLPFKVGPHPVVERVGEVRNGLTGVRPVEDERGGRVDRGPDAELSACAGRRGEVGQSVGDELGNRMTLEKVVVTGPAVRDRQLFRSDGRLQKGHSGRIDRAQAIGHRVSGDSVVRVGDVLSKKPGAVDVARARGDGCVLLSRSEKPALADRGDRVPVNRHARHGGRSADAGPLK